MCLITELPSPPAPPLHSRPYLRTPLPPPSPFQCVCVCVCVFIKLHFPLLNPSLAKMSSAGYFHARFLLSAFFSFLFFSDRVRPQFVLV